MNHWNVYASLSGFTTEIAEIIWRRGDKIGCLIDNYSKTLEESEFGRVVLSKNISPELIMNPIVIAMSNPGKRYIVKLEADTYGKWRYLPLIDSTSTISRTCTVHDGCVINCNTSIASRVVLKTFVHVNRSSSIGHDNIIEDFASIGPGAVLAGKIHVGRGAFVGAGSVIAPGIKIGANSTIGAGAVVIRDVEDNAVVVGNPAKTIKYNEYGFQGFGVPPIQ
jgi:sugar O-acyltransferase (sialic acid O-acetyltransferase NeuD family)